MSLGGPRECPLGTAASVHRTALATLVLIKNETFLIDYERVPSRATLVDHRWTKLESVLQRTQKIIQNTNCSHLYEDPSIKSSRLLRIPNQMDRLILKSL